MTKNGKAEEKKKINIALQGGGSHGAFSWGVLDRLLEDGRLEISAVSGTSAGAMNAVALADGFVRGGVDGARQKLDDFWRAVAAKGRFSPVQRMPWDVAWGNWSIENTPGYAFFDTMSRVFSPYVANPLGLNPLRDRLCVVQLSPGDGTADVVQIPAAGISSPNLVKLLSDPERLKIFHFARFDLAVLKSEGVVQTQILQAKLIKSGALTRKVTIKGVGVTKGAREAIVAAGGSVAE